MVVLLTTIYPSPGTAIFRLLNELNAKSTVSMNCAAATVIDGQQS